MNNLSPGLGNDRYGRFFWIFSFRNRKIIVSILIVVILLTALLLLQKFIIMETRLKQLSRYEPIYVLALKRELNIGDLIRVGDLKPMIFYKKEFDDLKYKDTQTNLISPALISCNYDFKTQELSGFKDVIGRVVNIPLHANTILRQEYLAPLGTLPGLINLVDAKHSLLDIEVPQSGFNVFIKPGDQVDIYEFNKENSILLARKIKVLMVDSLALGKAPLQVNVDSKLNRQLTLAIPEEIFTRVVKAKQQKALMVTYNYLPAPNKIIYHHPNKIKNEFQPLLIIQGAKKEIIHND